MSHSGAVGYWHSLQSLSRSWLTLPSFHKEHLTPSQWCYRELCLSQCMVPFTSIQYLFRENIMFQEQLLFILVQQSRVFCWHVHRSVFQVLKCKCKEFQISRTPAPRLALHPAGQNFIRGSSSFIRRVAVVYSALGGVLESSSRTLKNDHISLELSGKFSIRIHISSWKVCE